MKLKDLGMLAKEKEGFEIKTTSIKCRSPENCSFPNCNCDEPETIMGTIMPAYNKGYNQARREDNEVEIEVDVERLTRLLNNEIFRGYSFLMIDRKEGKKLFEKDTRTLAQAVAKTLPTILRGKDGGNL